MQTEAKKRLSGLKLRPLEVDDLAPVFHLGEKLFTARAVPNLYRTWDEYEVVGLFQSDSDYCFVAEIDDRLAGFTLGTIISKTNSAWKYGHLIWMGVEPSFARQGVFLRPVHNALVYDPLLLQLCLHIDKLGISLKVGFQAPGKDLRGPVSNEAL